jgi:hypothetical protein
MACGSSIYESGDEDRECEQEELNECGEEPDSENNYDNEDDDG